MLMRREMRIEKKEGRKRASERASESDDDDVYLALKPW